MRSWVSTDSLHTSVFSDRNTRDSRARVSERSERVACAVLLTQSQLLACGTPMCAQLLPTLLLPAAISPHGRFHAVRSRRGSKTRTCPRCIETRYDAETALRLEGESRAACSRASCGRAACSTLALCVRGTLESKRAHCPGFMPISLRTVPSATASSVRRYDKSS